MVVDFLNDILFQGKHGINKINNGIDDEDDDVPIDKDNLKDDIIEDNSEPEYKSVIFGKDDIISSTVLTPPEEEGDRLTSSTVLTPPKEIKTYKNLKN